MSTDLKQRPSTERMSPTPEQIIAEQKTQAKKLSDAKTAGTTATTLAVKPGSTAVAAPDRRTDVEKYIDEIAAASIVGRMIKFSKDGQFVTADDNEPIDETAEFIALCDETLIGWIKFYGDGNGVLLVTP